MSTLSSFNLENPTKKEALSLMGRALTQNRAEVIWRDACAAVGVHYEANTMADLETVFHYLSQQNGAVSIYGMALRARLFAYKNIEKHITTL